MFKFVHLSLLITMLFFPVYTTNKKIDGKKLAKKIGNSRVIAKNRLCKPKGSHDETLFPKVSYSETLFPKENHCLKTKCWTLILTGNDKKDGQPYYELYFSAKSQLEQLKEDKPFILKKLKGYFDAANISYKESNKRMNVEQKKDFSFFSDRIYNCINEAVTSDIDTTLDSLYVWRRLIPENENLTCGTWRIIFKNNNDISLRSNYVLLLKDYSNSKNLNENRSNFLEKFTELFNQKITSNFDIQSHHGAVAKDICNNLKILVEEEMDLVLARAEQKDIYILAQNVDKKDHKLWHF